MRALRADWTTPNVRAPACQRAWSWNCNGSTVIVLREGKCTYDVGMASMHAYGTRAIGNGNWPQKDAALRTRKHDARLD